MQPLNEEDQKPNPVVERVKMIMIAGLFIVHANRYSYITSSRFNNVMIFSFLDTLALGRRLCTTV